MNVTRADIARSLRAMGLEAGDRVMVHSSLSSMDTSRVGRRRLCRPSCTSSRVSAMTSSIMRPPSTPPLAFSSSMAISVPRIVLLPVSVSNEPM